MNFFKYNFLTFKLKNCIAKYWLVTLNTGMEYMYDQFRKRIKFEALCNH